MASIPFSSSIASDDISPIATSLERRKICSVRSKEGDNVVGVGEFAVCDEEEVYLVCLGLGSCVGIAIWDPSSKIGGLAHAMLPCYEFGRDKSNAAKYADTAVFLMVDELIEKGAKKSSLRAKMAGGAQMFQFATNDMLNIGLKNAESARLALIKEGIPLISEDCGGNKGRTVFFYPSTGTYRINKGQEIYEI